MLEPSARACPRCGQAVMVAQATFCKQCGAALAGAAPAGRQPDWHSLLAAALSIVPGLGHLYRRRPLAAVAWFIGLAIAYHFVFALGLMLHLVCAANAALTGVAGDRPALRDTRGATP